MSAPTLRLRDGETAVVGYGSLLWHASISRTIGREYTGPFLSCRLEGWRRSWDVSMPNQAFYYQERSERVYPARILYLNVRPLAAALLNCVVFVLTADELRAMDEREWIYQQAVVTESLRGVRVEGGDARIYVARPEHVTTAPARPREAAVRASYLRVLEHALQRVDPAFRGEYDRTTDPVPEHLVVEDLLDPERPTPWAAAGFGYRPDPAPVTDPTPR